MGKNKARRKSNKKTVQKKDGVWKLFPLQFVIAVLPLILYLYQGNSGYGIYSWNSANDSYLDVFLHGKMVVFVVTAAITMILLTRRIALLGWESRKRFLYSFVPLLVYLSMVIISTLASENSKLSLTGAMDQKEPVWVLVGYVIMTMYAYLVLETVEDVLRLTGAAVAGGLCMAFLGVLQTFGKDPLATEAVQRLFAGSDYVDMYGALRLTFPAGQAYGTLFNPNYVGTYVAMYIPILLAGLFCFRILWKKVICGVTVAGLLVMLFASQSRTGLIAIAAILVLLVVFLGRELWRRWYVTVPAVLLAVVTFFVIDASRDHLLTGRLKEMFLAEQSQTALWGIDTTGDGVRVVYKDTEFTVKQESEENGFSFRVYEKGEEKEVLYGPEPGYWHVTLTNGEQISIQNVLYETEPAFGLNLDGRDYYFICPAARTDYKYINLKIGRLDECRIPANALPGYETMASGRGYVWGRTIPLLAKYWLVGSGPDTFAVTFPQNDYVARYKIGADDIIYTRAHNFYLQTGVQTGVVSLIALLVFYGIYFAGSFRRYFFCRLRRTEEWLGLAILLSTVGFLATGLANDSLIVVSPVFYVLLGAGMAVNHRLCPVKKVQKNK